VTKLVRLPQQVYLDLLGERERLQRRWDRATPPGILRIRASLGDTVADLLAMRARQRARRKDGKK
jgi:hypothetical protein